MGNGSCDIGLYLDIQLEGPPNGRETTEMPGYQVHPRYFWRCFLILCQITYRNDLQTYSTVIHEAGMLDQI